MKYRRKPVVRDVVDAIKGPEAYIVQRDEGKIEAIPFDMFERDYEPVRRSPAVKKPRKPRARKDSTTTTGAINNGHVPS